MRSSHEKVILIICTNVTPKSNFVTSCVAEISYGYNLWLWLYTEEGTVDISVVGSLVQQVSNFSYLGMIISSDGSMDRELSARIWKASGAFNQLSNNNQHNVSDIQSCGSHNIVLQK